MEMEPISSFQEDTLYPEKDLLAAEHLQSQVNENSGNHHGHHFSYNY